MTGIKLKPQLLDAPESSKKSSVTTYSTLGHKSGIYNGHQFMLTCRFCRRVFTLLPRVYGK